MTLAESQKVLYATYIGTIQRTLSEDLKLGHYARIRAIRIDDEDKPWFDVQLVHGPQQHEPTMKRGPPPTLLWYALCHALPCALPCVVLFHCIRAFYVWPQL